MKLDSFILGGVISLGMIFEAVDIFMCSMHVFYSYTRILLQMTYQDLVK